MGRTPSSRLKQSIAKVGHKRKKLGPQPQFIQLTLRKRVKTTPPPRYLIHPSHDQSGEFGGTRMTVTLGPTAAQSCHYGSKTSVRSIRKWMKPLHDKDGSTEWVAGHLLNDNLGGNGEDTKNLTPLTHKANRNHATFEQKIKNACDRSLSYHEQHKDDPDWYGIEYSVEVSNLAYNKKVKPYHRVASYIVINARAVKVNKITGKVTKLTSANNPLGFQTITDAKITQ